MNEPSSRICREVHEQLPRLVDGTLPRFHTRLVRRHLRRCQECGTELARQEAVAHGLEQIGNASAQATEPPPGELLDAILARAQSPGLRERAAVPARGAVSGERPTLTIAFLLAAAVVGTALGMLLWRIGRAISSRIWRTSRRASP